MVQFRGLGVRSYFYSTFLEVTSWKKDQKNSCSSCANHTSTFADHPHNLFPRSRDLFGNVTKSSFLIVNIFLQVYQILCSCLEYPIHRKRNPLSFCHEKSGSLLLLKYFSNMVQRLEWFCWKLCHNICFEHISLKTS